MPKHFEFRSGIKQYFYPMKKIVLVLFTSMGLFLNTFAAKEKPNCKIQIEIEDQQEGILLIRKLTMGNNDTVKYTGGKMNHELFFTEPLPVFLSDEDGRYQIFFAEPNATVKLKIQVKNGIKVTLLEGSASNEIFRSLIRNQEPVQQASQRTAALLQEPSVNRDSVNAVLMQYNNQLKNNFFNFLKTNSTSEVASFVVYSSIMNERSLNIHMADTMFQFLKGNATTGFYGKEISKTMNRLKSVEVGYIAPDFTLADSAGKKYTLRKIDADYILLDFWASWCGPCKAEIPHMKKAYERFHSKGFEIVSVSIDAKEEAWRNALTQFQMPWIHLLEKDRVVSDLYHFPTIPKTVLMDKTGKIVAADLRGDALELKLELLLKK